MSKQPSDRRSFLAGIPAAVAAMVGLGRAKAAPAPAAIPAVAAPPRPRPPDYRVVARYNDGSGSTAVFGRHLPDGNAEARRHFGIAVGALHACGGGMVLLQADTPAGWKALAMSQTTR